MPHSRINIKVQKIVAIVAVLLFAVKIAAWYYTRSIAILTDALESIVNMVAGFVGLYSLYVSARPRDFDHPYGHGKVEFISAALEGSVIIIAGIFIMYKSVVAFFTPQEVERVGLGIYLVSATAVINFLVGIWCERVGKKHKSPALISSGKHLQTDTYTTLGIIVGLILLHFTGVPWIDSATAIVFSCIIIFTGIKILRSSVGGIMDEADEDLLHDLVETINEKRRINWIDLHNTRIIKYGATLHIDCHLTVPWYFDVRQAHHEIDELSELARSKYGDSLELFVHSDDCKNYSCNICHKADCSVRQEPFLKTIHWTIANIRENKKHSINTHE